MTSAYLNLVFTRSVDGDHATMQRWYNDHIGILWRCPTLQRATLYRRDAEVAQEADYICCYTFPDEAGFLEYEHGEAREAARLVVVNGWASEGLTITQRRQFRRGWTQTRRAGEGEGKGDRVMTVLALRLGAGPWTDVSRWLLDRLHGLLAAGTVGSVTLMRAVDASDAGGDVLLWLGSQAPLANPHVWLDVELPGMPGPVGEVGHRPVSVERLWAWRGQRVSDWQR